MDHAGIEVKNKTGKEVDGTSLSNNPPQVCCERSRVQMLAQTKVKIQQALGHFRTVYGLNGRMAKNMD
jgi:hypothetical protein